MYQTMFQTDEVMIFRLQTGSAADYSAIFWIRQCYYQYMLLWHECNNNCHLFNKTNSVIINICPYGMDIMTTDHMQQALVGTKHWYFIFPRTYVYILFESCWRAQHWASRCVDFKSTNSRNTQDGRKIFWRQFEQLLVEYMIIDERLY